MKAINNCLMMRHISDMRTSSQDVNIRIITNYLNIMVRGCVKRPGCLMVRHSSDERNPPKDVRVRFPARAHTIPLGGF